ncbi:unnamed protein product [Ixodes pacificus]
MFICAPSTTVPSWRSCSGKRASLAVIACPKAEGKRIDPDGSPSLVGNNPSRITVISHPVSRIAFVGTPAQTISTRCKLEVQVARGGPVASFATNNPELSGVGSSSPTTIDWIRDTFEPATK